MIDAHGFSAAAKQMNAGRFGAVAPTERAVVQAAPPVTTATVQEPARSFSGLEQHLAWAADAQQAVGRVVAALDGAVLVRRMGVGPQRLQGAGADVAERVTSDLGSVIEHARRGAQELNVESGPSVTVADDTGTEHSLSKLALAWRSLDGTAEALLREVRSDVAVGGGSGTKPAFGSRDWRRDLVVSSVANVVTEASMLTELVDAAKVRTEARRIVADARQEVASAVADDATARAGRIAHDARVTQELRRQLGDGSTTP